MEHWPDEDTILDLVSGRLSPGEVARVERHLDTCATCLDVVADAADAIAFGSGDTTAPRPAKPQRVIAGYRLLTRVGAGGMGVVYRAVHEATGQLCAFKTVLPQTQGALTAMHREVQALNRLRHPGVVRILDHGIEEQRPWYAMELIEGPTLQQHFAEVRGPRSADAAGVGAAPSPEQLARTLGVLRSVCGTLAFLHGRGVVHRDIKPQNIVIRPDGTPVLVDFGLVVQNELLGRMLLASAEVVGGTPLYMAPEQIRGELVDARADLYALGCILYEAVTGRPPFGGLDVTVHQIFVDHLNTDPAPPSTLAPGVEPALERLILRLLQKSPRDRLGYAEDLALALTPFCTPSPHATFPRAQPYVYRPEFIGRGDLLHRLDDALHRAVAGRGGRVFVSGDSGVGKTRLAAEAARRARFLGFRVVLGACVTIGAHPTRDAEQAAALSPLRPLLRELVEACAGSRARADSLVGPYGRVLGAYEPALLDLPGQDAYPDLPRLPAQAARERLLGALHATISRLAEERPLLLVLDDLQWADELSLEMLDKAPADLFERHRILFVGAYRSGEAGAHLTRVAGARGAHRLPLDRFEPEAIEEMVGDMLALDEVPPSLLGRLSAASGGNPLFVAEYMRAAVDEGWIVRENGARWRFAGAAAPLLPGSFSELLDRRLASLSSPARLLTGAAAVLGGEVEEDVLLATVALTETESADALRELVARGVLEDPTGDRLRFVHERLREAAYDALPADDRRTKHRRAALAIERARRGPARIPYHAVLAHHWARAGVPSEAIANLELAGEQALDRAAHAEAANLFLRALHLAPLVHDQGEPVAAERVARWERRLGEAYFALGDLERCEERSKRALAGFGHALPSSRSGLSLALLVQLAQQVRHLARPGQEVAGSPAERALLKESAQAATRVAQRRYFAEDGLGLVGAALLAVNLAERAAEDRLVALPYSLLGYLAGVGRLHGFADAYFTRARRSAEADDDLRALGDAVMHETLLYGGYGRFDQARELGRRMLDRLADFRHPQQEEGVRIVVAHVDLCAGRYDASMESGGALLASARGRGHRQNEAFGLYAIARGLIRLRRFDEALARLAEARPALNELPHDALAESICAGLTALALTERGDLDGAEPMADAAMAAIARARPSPFSLADGYDGAAELYLALWQRALRAGVPVPVSIPRRAALAGAERRRFAVLFPIGRPRYLLHVGRVLALQGHSRGAALAFGRARVSAAALGMPHEIALAERLLGELHRSPA